jgi:hypothetical protein
MVERLGWLDGVVLEALRLGVGIGIENWFINRSATRPETSTTHFVRVGFDHHKTSAVWYAWVLRCRTSREAGDGQIKGSPEKVYRAHLAYEPTTKLRKNPAGLHQNAPKPMRMFGIIGRMFLILLKGGSILHFDWRGPDGYRNPKRCQG